MKTKKLREFPYAVGTHVECIGTDSYLFSSYELIAGILNDEWVFCNELPDLIAYDHLKAFGKLYGIDEAAFRSCIKDHVLINRFTGEVKERGF